MYSQFAVQGGPYPVQVEIGFTPETQYGKFITRIDKNVGNILSIVNALSKNDPTFMSGNVTKSISYDVLHGINKIYPYSYPILQDQDQYQDQDQDPDNILEPKEPNIKEFLLHTFSSVYLTYEELSKINRNLSGNKYIFISTYPPIRVHNPNGTIRHNAYSIARYKVDFPDRYGILSAIISGHGSYEFKDIFFNTARDRGINAILKSLNNYSKFIETAGILFSISLHKIEADLIKSGVYNNVNTLHEDVKSENCRQHIPKIVISKVIIDTQNYGD